jgi:hypothetical protein
VTRGTFAQLGWRWRSVNGSNVAHLVPAKPGKGSRTACNRLPVPSAEVLTATLFAEIPLCERCARAER